CIELIHPQEIRILGAAGFVASACEFRSGQLPEAELFRLRIQLSEMSAACGEPHRSVRAEINSMRQAERRPQWVVFELLRLRIQHEQLVLWSVHLGYGQPHSSIRGTDGSGIATG